MICVMSKIKGIMYKRVTPEGHTVDGMVRDGIYQVTVETWYKWIEEPKSRLEESMLSMWVSRCKGSRTWGSLNFRKNTKTRTKLVRKQIIGEVIQALGMGGRDWAEYKLCFQTMQDAFHSPLWTPSPLFSALLCAQEAAFYSNKRILFSWGGPLQDTSRQVER